MIENVQTQVGHLPGGAEMDALTAGIPPDPTADDTHPLDSEDNLALLEKLQDWYDEELDRQRPNRLQMAMDCDYYDHLQIDEKTRIDLDDRGQAPLVFNRIKLTIDWLLGTEVKTRFDWLVRPRNETDVDIAPIKTDLLKYVADQNRSGVQRSGAFKDQVVAGLGWLESGITTDPTVEMVYDRQESWRNVVHDSRAKPDQSDARFLFRHRFVDIDMAEAMFPTRTDIIGESTMGIDDAETADGVAGRNWYMGELLNSGLTDGDTYATQYLTAGHWSAAKSRRMRVRLTEAWWRVPQTKTILRGEVNGGGDGDEYDANNPLHQEAVQSGFAAVVDNLTLQMHHAIFCDRGLLYVGVMPYRHNKWPLIPLWCYRRDRDGMPYGVVRGMRDPQDDFNKRMSKALFLLSVNRVLYTEGAFGEDEEEARIELARPDAFQSYKRNHEVKIDQGSAFAAPQLDLAQKDLEYIEAAGGVSTDQMTGGGGLGQSGVALAARAQMGNVTTAPIFDHYRDAFEMHGRNILSLIEQYYTMPRVIRITGQRAADAQFMSINQRDPADPMRFLNDVARGECDFVIDEQDFRATSRQALFDSIIAIIGKLLPAQIPMYLDLAFDLLDIPQGKEMAKRARLVNGMDPPDGTPITPEEQQANAQRKQMAQMQAGLQMRMLMAQAGKLEAEAKRIGSDAALKDAQAIMAGMTTLYEAMQAGGVIVMTPGVTTAGDELLRAVGFQDQSGPGVALPFPTQGAPAVDGGAAAQPAPRIQPPHGPPVAQPQPVQPPLAPRAVGPGGEGMPPHESMPNPAPHFQPGPPPPVRTAGARHGIETARPDGVPK